MKLRYLIFIFALLIAAGCGKDKPPVKAEPKAPEKAVLVFPEQNAVCTSGTVISTTETSIVFNWKAANNTDSYDVSIRNLLTGIITVKTVLNNQLTATLLRNTPYSWRVVSKSAASSVTADSGAWAFYVAGLGTTSYSPFPATANTPAFGQVFPAGTTKVNLSWTGSDVDNDIAAYDVYFGTTQSPPLLKSGVTATSVTDQPVSAGNSYYWKIITKDVRGNTSDSGLFIFDVK